MRVTKLLCVGLFVWLLIPGCGGGEGTETTDKPDTGPSGGGGTENKPDTGPSGDGGTDGGDDVDSGEEASAGSGGQVTEGPYVCPTPASEQELPYTMEVSCGFKRCIPGTGCISKCTSDDDCVTPEEIGYDPALWEFYCETGGGNCLFRRFEYED